MSGIEVIISDVDFPEVREVDLKLIELARTLQGKIVTNDFNLNKVAQLRGVEVLNVNELANSLKPVVLPGEIMKVFILKEGKEYNQGVAYLDDGTMVVVDNARKMISKTIDIVVTSVLQTTAGKMIFGRYIEQGSQSQAPRPSSRRRRSRAAEAGACAAAATDVIYNLQVGIYKASPISLLFVNCALVNCEFPSVSLVADGLLPDPRHHRLHDRARRGVARVEPVRSARLHRARLRAAWSWLILKTTGVRVTVEGLERVTPGTTYIFVSNHQSIYDTPVVFARCRFSCASSRRNRSRGSRCSAGICGAAAISSSIAGIRIARAF